MNAALALAWLLQSPSTPPPYPSPTCGGREEAETADRPRERLALQARDANGQETPEDGAVSYALGWWRAPDLTAPGQPFTLYDLRYRATDNVATTNAFAARLKVERLGFLGLDIDGEARRLTLTTQRLGLGFGELGGSYDFLGSYRARWFIVDADAHLRSAVEGKGWVVGSAASGRLTPDLELVGRFKSETRKAPPSAAEEIPRVAALGLLYQGGPRFEAFAEASRSRVRTSGGLEFDRDLLDLAFQGYALGAEANGEMFIESNLGRFPRRQVTASGAARVPLGGRALFETSALGRWERRGPRLEYRYRTGLAWFGRRVHLARAGEAAERTADLARRACALGYNERREHDDDGRRSLRERLALSPLRDDLEEDLVALHRAQVAERNVPLLGFELEAGSETVTAVESRAWRAFVGVPWPLAPPWSHDENASPFLRLQFERRRDLYGVAFRAVERTWELEAQLDRQMTLILRWRKGDPTPVDIIRATPIVRTLELEYVYAFGR